MHLINNGTAQTLLIAPGLMIADYTAMPILDDLATIREAMTCEPDLKAGYHLLVNVTGVGSAKPDPELRAGFVALMRIAPVKSCAYVFTIRGFFGAAIRMVFSSFTLVGRERPEKVFDRLDAACDWLAAESMIPLSALQDHFAALASARAPEAGIASVPVSVDARSGR